MRVLLAITVGLWLMAVPICAQTPQPASPAGGGVPQAEAQQPPNPCSGKSAKECGVSPEDFKTAREAYGRGLKLQKRQPEQALSAFEEAARLVPRNLEYLKAREMLRQQLVYEHVQQGNELLLQSQATEAAKEFRRALELDPGNQFAAQRLHDLANVRVPPLPTFIEPEPEEEEVMLRPKPGAQTLHLIGDTRGAYTQVGAAFGIKVTFDESTPSRTVRLDLDKVTFSQAMDALAVVTRTFAVPVTSSEILVAANTPAKHKELDRWLLRTFYLPETSAPQELTDVVNLLRTLFEIRLVTQAPASSTITVRGPAPAVLAATQFLQTLWAGKPQVMLDFDVYEISSQVLQAIGVNLPLQFNVFNIPQSALAALLGNSNIQQLLNQLNSAGGLANLANSASISALLAQLQQQQSSLFQNPVATFGGGTTLMGVSVPPATVNFSKNHSLVLTLEKVSMRASQGNAATFRLGTRYPVLNAAYTSFFNNPLAQAAGQVAGQLGSSSAASLGAFPSFTYEDLGITIKAKPTIHGTSEVTLDMELELKSLGGQSFNGVPVINNRSYKGVITVRNHEPAVVAGALSRSEQQTLTGIPGLSRVPVLNTAISNKNKQQTDDEVLVLITPHILSAAPSGSTTAIVVPKE
jgi:general secretion pathway protein D